MGIINWKLLIKNVCFNFLLCLLIIQKLKVYKWLRLSESHYWLTNLFLF